MGFSATHTRTRVWLACAPILCALGCALGLALAVALVAAPTTALARSPRGGSGGTGGSGLSGGSSSTSSAQAPASNSTISGIAAPVIHLSGVINASGDGITLTVAASGVQGHPLTLTGEAPASDAGETIDIESTKTGGTVWSNATAAVIAPSGSFRARWTPATSARVDLRAVLAGAAGGTGTDGGSGLSDTGSASTAASQLQTAPLTISIFRNAVATMYGPGFWGHHTACGERLTRSTLGVASRTLRCGTRVAILYHGHEITVPVIDRGPFAKGVTWDLTMATAKALGIRETVTVGTLTPAPAPALAAGG